MGLNEMQEMQFMNWYSEHHGTKVIGRRGPQIQKLEENNKCGALSENIWEEDA